MITYEKSQRLSQLIAAYCAAAVAESWKGAGYPDDMVVLEQELAAAKNELDVFVASITANRDTIHLPQNVRQARAMLAVASMYLQEHEPKPENKDDNPPA